MAARAGGGGDRLPSLDGLRAISAAMVVVGHAEKMIHVGRKLPFGTGIVDVWGPVGVTMFFVLSGFLITRLLLGERRASGEIDLPAFYLRRTFRILPAYWAYLAAVALLATARLVIAPPHGFARALFFSTDYLTPDSWVLNQSWSLSVEEQFYLFWPLLLLAAGALRARRMALVLIAVAPALRVLTYFLTPALRPSITGMLHVRVDALMIGCWAALELDLRPGSSLLRFLARPRIALTATIYCAFLAACVRRIGLLNCAIGYSIEAFCACSVLLWAVQNQASRTGRFLNSPPLVHLGTISYSLYLWQQLWLSHDSPTPLWLAPFLVAGAVACAELSYRFVESPMLRLRGRLRWIRAQRPASLQAQPA